MACQAHPVYSICLSFAQVNSFEYFLAKVPPDGLKGWIVLSASSCHRFCWRPRFPGTQQYIGFKGRIHCFLFCLSLDFKVWYQVKRAKRHSLENAVCYRNSPGSYWSSSHWRSAYCKNGIFSLVCLGKNRHNNIIPLEKTHTCHVSKVSDHVLST